MSGRFHPIPGSVGRKKSVREDGAAESGKVICRRIDPAHAAFCWLGAILSVGREANQTYGVDSPN